MKKKKRALGIDAFAEQLKRQKKAREPFLKPRTNQTVRATFRLDPSDVRVMVVALEEQPPIPMLLICPACKQRHIDEGEFATKPHHTHACQHCGSVWRPAVVKTVGVRFLPGFKNQPAQPPTGPRGFSGF